MGRTVHLPVEMGRASVYICAIFSSASLLPLHVSFAITDGVVQRTVAQSGAPRASSATSNPARRIATSALKNPPAIFASRSYETPNRSRESHTCDDGFEAFQCPQKWGAGEEIPSCTASGAPSPWCCGTPDHGGSSSGCCRATRPTRRAPSTGPALGGPDCTGGAMGCVDTCQLPQTAATAAAVAGSGVGCDPHPNGSGLSPRKSVSAWTNAHRVLSLDCEKSTRATRRATRAPSKAPEM